MIAYKVSLLLAKARLNLLKNFCFLTVVGLSSLFFCTMIVSPCYAGNNSPDPSTQSETVGKYTITVSGSATQQAQKWDMSSASFNVSVTYTADGTDASKDIASQSHTVVVSGATMDTASGPSGFTQTYPSDGSSSFTSSGTTLPGIGTGFQCLDGPAISLSTSVKMQDGTELGAGSSISVKIVCLGQ